MKYYGADDAVNLKVRSYNFTAEVQNGKVSPLGYRMRHTKKHILLCS